MREEQTNTNQMKQNHERESSSSSSLYLFFVPVLRNLLKSKHNTIYNMKNIDPEKSNSNQPPPIYICLVVSLSPQWLLIFSKKKKFNGRPLTLVLLQQSLSKPQTQPWPTTHRSSPPLQHLLRWWFSS